MTISNSSFTGRADIIRNNFNNTASIWEVKPNNPRYYGSGGRGTKQITRYIAQALLGDVHKGTLTFPNHLVAGEPIVPFYLDVPSLTGGTETLKVSPSPQYSTIPNESGLILYEQKNKEEQIPEYEYEQVSAVDLINHYATYAVPSMVKVGITDLVITFAEVVISGVAMGVCIMYAGDIIPAMNGVINGTVNPGTITTALETAVESNELVVINLSEASINQILYYASTSLAA